MKKVILIVVAVILVIAVALFFILRKPAAVVSVENHIKEIGEVTLDSIDEINAAQEEYDALPDNYKEKVENIKDLENALADYNILLDQEKAEEVDELIESIGTVTKDSGDAIDEAQEAYDELTNSQLAFVENYDLLKQAQEDFYMLEINEAIELIKAIPQTADDMEALESAIAEAENKYNSLDAEKQAKVSNAGDIAKAKKKLEAAKKAKEEAEKAAKEKAAKEKAAKEKAAKEKASGNSGSGSDGSSESSGIGGFDISGVLENVGKQILGEIIKKAMQQ